MRQKGIAHLFLLVIVVIIGIGAVGYFAYQNARQEKETVNDIQQNKTLISTSPSPATTRPTSIETTSTPESTIQPSQDSKWLVYKHTKFPDKPDWEIPWSGFNLYYPSTWYIEEKKDDSLPALDLRISKTVMEITLK